MKYFLQTACAAALIGLSGNVYAAQNGINYDPAHNPNWNQFQRGAKLDEMKRIITNDLAQIKKMGFNAIKTYYSAYCTNIPDKCVHIADFVNSLYPNGEIKVMLGVFEFTTLIQPSPCNPEATCLVWTQAQIKSAKTQATKLKDKGTILGIVVGNEDMFDFRGDLLNNTLCFGDKKNKKNEQKCNMIQRIVDDIQDIQGEVPDSLKDKVTTAQRQPDWCGGSDPGCASNRNNSLNQTTDGANLLKTISAAGVNIFPYWSPNFLKETECNPADPSKKGTDSQALCTQPTAQNVLNALKGVSGSTVKSVIVTEEGWPSINSNGQNPTGQSQENDYYKNWQVHKDQMFDSYYFMAYDLAPPVCPTDPNPDPNDANCHFGLCKANGDDKTGSDIKPSCK